MKKSGKRRKKRSYRSQPFPRCFHATAPLRSSKKTHGASPLAAKVLLTLSCFALPPLPFAITPPSSTLFCRLRCRLVAVAKFLLDTLIRLHQNGGKRKDLCSIIFERVRTYITKKQNADLRSVKIGFFLYGERKR